MSTVKTLGGPKIELVAACRDCKIKHHSLVNTGTDFLREIDEFQNKHRGHRFEFNTPKRHIPRDLDDSAFERSGIAPWWLNFKDNANIKTAYAGAVNLTITLASLATSSGLLAGRASTAIDETSNLYLDEGISGFITNGTTPTTSLEIDVWAYATVDDGPTYPSGGTGGGTRITGTDANFSFSTVNQYSSSLKLVASMTNSSTTNETNNFGPVSLASLHGGFMPSKWGVWVVHNTAVNLNSTSGNHQITAKPLYATSI